VCSCGSTTTPQQHPRPSAVMPMRCRRPSKPPSEFGSPDELECSDSTCCFQASSSDSSGSFFKARRQQRLIGPHDSMRSSLSSSWPILYVTLTKSTATFRSSSMVKVNRRQAPVDACTTPPNAIDRS